MKAAERRSKREPDQSGGVIVPWRDRWRRAEVDVGALTLAGRDRRVAWPARGLARATSAYLRAPLREVLDHSEWVWLLDATLDRLLRASAFAALGRAHAARLRALAENRPADPSGWRGNLLALALWTSPIAVAVLLSRVI